MNTEDINIEDIKVGEMYNVRVKVSRINAAGVFCYACDKDGTYLGKHPNLFTEAEVEAFTPITPEPAPKHDPCRIFKEGDIVAPQEVNGRIFSGAVEELIGQNCVVVEDELECCNVRIRHGEDEYTIDPAYIELITPVEEQEPYKCGEGIDAQLIFVNDELFAEFENEEDAKRVCALLNAELRKEQS